MSIFNYFKSEQNVIYLDRQSMCVLNTKPEIKIDFSNQVVYALEVQNESLLEKDIANFLRASDLKGDVIFVLSKNIVFSKKVSRDMIINQDELNKLIISTFPFSKKYLNIKFIDLKKDDVVDMIIANKNYYHSVVRILENGGIKVTSVVPELAYELILGTPQTMESVYDAVVSNSEIAQRVNLIEND